MRSLADTLRPIDHVVLPTGDLTTARARLTAMGFTVAADGVHPFGTANCCVYLADDTFLEPLAVADRAAAAQAAAAGNVFVARDKAYRARHGEEGFSALVMGTNNARADHASFGAHGLSAGEMLAFSRPFVDAEGQQDTASFLLAFAADAIAPDSFFFTCERVNSPKVDRSALQRHENGVLGLSSVMLSAPDPDRYRDLLEEVAGGGSTRSEAGLQLATRGSSLTVLKHDELKARLGIVADEMDELRLRAISFAAPDIALVQAVLARNNIPFERREERLVIAPAAGQGAHFIFEGLR